VSRNSEFIRHKPCPNCGSKDNLAEYTDHEYCFGCGYTVKGKSVRTQQVKRTTSSIALPDDSDPYIPMHALEWLKQYEITQNEIKQNRLLYSEYRSLLVFPYFGEYDNQLLGWQGRYFGDNPKHPKWFTKGNVKDFIHPIGLDKSKQAGTMVYVEDIVSAIKVGRVYGCVPVFGSFIPRTHSIRSLSG